MEGIEQLMQLGFSQYEAQAYVALLKESPLNGYELAKASGIPRPNIYSVLQKLEEEGAVLRIATPEGTRYSPISSEELLAKIRRSQQQSIEAASACLGQIIAPPNTNFILNFQGYSELIDQARALIERADRHLLLSVWPEEAAALTEPVQQALERGVQLTTLCLRGCPNPCPACGGAVFRYALAPTQSSRWLVLVSDDSELLAGEISLADGSTAAVRTRQKMMVTLTGSYIQNSIALAALLTRFGDQLSSQTGDESLAALSHLHPLSAPEQGTWLDAMRQMLHLSDRPTK